MKRTTDLFIGLCYLILLRLVSAKNAVNNSKKDSNINYILRRAGAAFPALIEHDRAAYPEPLPTLAPKALDPLPSKTLYQGVRYKDDTRVFRKPFEHEPKLTGQQVVVQGLFDCVISHISIESTEAIPVLLRGGAGYRHFTAVVKSKPHHELKGQIRAYCRSKDKPRINEKKEKPQRRFNFEGHSKEEKLNES